MLGGLLAALVLGGAWLPLLGWTFVGLVVAGAGSWRRFVIFCGATALLFVLWFNLSLAPAIDSSDGPGAIDGALFGVGSAIACFFVCALCGIVTAARANFLKRLALAEKGPE